MKVYWSHKASALRRELLMAMLCTEAERGKGE